MLRLSSLAAIQKKTGIFIASFEKELSEKKFSMATEFVLIIELQKTVFCICDVRVINLIICCVPNALIYQQRNDRHTID